MPRIELDTGLRYNYLEWPSDSDHTLVLIHGFLDFCGSWTRTVDAALQERFHVLAPDMRGHGDSDRVGPGGYYHFLDYVADLRSFIAKLGRERVSIVGHSMGGSIAGYYAGCFSEELERVVLMEGMGPPDNKNEPPDQVKQWIRDWKRAGATAPTGYPSIAAAAERLRARDSLLSVELSLELAEAGTYEREGERFFKHDPLHLSRGPIGYSVETAQTFWERISCPVLLIEGSESTLRHSPGERERRRGSLPSSQEIVIQGAGHMMQRDKPAELSRILQQFLS